MSVEGVKPLFEDPGAPAELREFVALGRADGPNQRELDRLAARLGPALGLSAAALAVSSASALGSPPANVAAAAQPLAAVQGGLFGKLMASTGGKLMALGLSVGLGVWVLSHGRSVEPATQRSQPPVSAPAARVAAARPAAAPQAAVEPPPVQQPAPALTEQPARVARRRNPPAPAALQPVTPAPAAELPATPPSELHLMQEAQALRAQPGQALSVLNKHRELYPRGLLAQEREVLAVELLLKAGQLEQARARVNQFQSTYGGSAHLPRLHALLTRAQAK